jgi:hypothetical protein
MTIYCPLSGHLLVTSNELRLESSVWADTGRGLASIGPHYGQILATAFRISESCRSGRELTRYWSLRGQILVRACVDRRCAVDESRGAMLGPRGSCLEVPKVALFSRPAGRSRTALR